jgi:hypothetical protein
MVGVSNNQKVSWTNISNFLAMFFLAVQLIIILLYFLLAKSGQSDTFAWLGILFWIILPLAGLYNLLAGIFNSLTHRGRIAIVNWLNVVISLAPLVFYILLSGVALQNS